VQRAYVEVRISRTPETPPEENQAGEQQSEEKPPANP